MKLGIRGRFPVTWNGLTRPGFRCPGTDLSGNYGV